MSDTSKPVEKLKAPRAAKPKPALGAARLRRLAALPPDASAAQIASALYAEFDLTVSHETIRKWAAQLDIDTTDVRADVRADL